MSIPENAIAVVGMAGRFPGAKDVSAFWSNLRRGKESIVTLSEQELRDAGVSDKTLADPAYVRRAPLLDGIDEFDAGFFGFPPLAAQVLDPQHRLFLQCAWHALEDAGADPHGSTARSAYTEPAPQRLSAAQPAVASRPERCVGRGTQLRPVQPVLAE